VYVRACDLSLNLQGWLASVEADAKRRVLSAIEAVAKTSFIYITACKLDLDFYSLFCHEFEPDLNTVQVISLLVSYRTNMVNLEIDTRRLLYR
jgi:hypothetical protein